MLSESKNKEEIFDLEKLNVMTKRGELKNISKVIEEVFLKNKLELNR